MNASLVKKLSVPQLDRKLTKIIISYFTFPWERKKKKKKTQRDAVLHKQRGGEEFHD